MEHSLFVLSFVLQCLPRAGGEHACMSATARRVGRIAAAESSAGAYSAFPTARFARNLS